MTKNYFLLLFFSCSLAVQQPDPNQPKAEGAQMVPMRGEQLGVVTNWPPSLEAALQRWGTISPKAPCLTTMDTNGKPLYVLTYGKSWKSCIAACHPKGQIFGSELKEKGLKYFCVKTKIQNEHRTPHMTTNKSS